MWGGAADNSNVYYGLSSGGMSALKLTTGEKVWYTPRAKVGPRVNNAAAVSAIPGVAFVGGSDGILRALSTSDGKVIWEYNTARDFDTVNKVAAHGGAINSIVTLHHRERDGIHRIRIRSQRRQFRQCVAGVLT